MKVTMYDIGIILQEVVNEQYKEYECSLQCAQTFNMPSILRLFYQSTLLCSIFETINLILFFNTILAYVMMFIYI
jgi:hypothetical protein